MNRKVGFGLIGLGAISKIHSFALEKSENCKLVAAYDLNSERVSSFSKEHNCKGFTDLDSFLKNDEMDAVIIATPSGYHLDPALNSIRSGKHVLIEKPLEITKDRCDLLINEARVHGVKLGGVFQSRFYDVPLLIKKALDDGRFGKLVMIEASVKWFRSQEYYDSGAWRGTWAVDGGGALMNQSIHAVDLLSWFGGPVSDIHAMASLIAHERIEVEDTAVAIMKFENGGYGVLEGATSIYPGFSKRIEICGTKGSAIMEEDSLVKWSFDDETAEDDQIRSKYISASSSGGASDPLAINYKGHMFQFDDFAKAIIDDRKPLVDGKEAAKAVDIINRIYESAGLR